MSVIRTDGTVRRVANKLFLLSWPLVVAIAGLVGFRGPDGLGLSLLGIAGFLAVACSVLVIIYDRADATAEIAEGMPEAERNVMAKGRTAAWIAIVSSLALAILVWSDWRVIPWGFGLAFVVGIVIAPAALVFEMVARRRR